MAKKKSRKPRRKPTRPKKTAPKSIWSKYLPILVMLAFVGLAFSPVLQADFVNIDDDKLILQKSKTMAGQPEKIFIANWGSPHFKPVVYTSWIVEQKIFGFNPFIFHLDNLLLHLCNVLLVYFVLLRLGSCFELTRKRKIPIALASALIFGLHPMHVESVAWAVERKDVLYSFFYLLSILFYLRYLEKKEVLQLGLSAGMFLLSVFSKSPGLTLPLVLVLIDYAYGRKIQKQLLLEKLGHLVIFLFALVAFGVFSSSGGEGSVGNLLVTEEKLAKADNVVNLPTFYAKLVLSGFKAIMWYLHTLIPAKMSLAYPRDSMLSFFGPLIHVFPVLLAGFVALLVAMRKKWKFFVFCHAFFLITLALAIIRSSPGLGIFFSDRYLYMALLGPVLFFTAWILNPAFLPKLSTQIRRGLLGLIALIFAVLTFQASIVWQDTEKLWTNAIEKYPNVDYAYVNRGSHYRELGQYDIALADLNRAISIDATTNGLIQRGLVLRQMGRPADAIQDYNRALAKEPENTQAILNRGNAYLDVGKFREAIQDYNTFAAQDPDDAKMLTNRAAALASIQQYDQAIADLNNAQRIRPAHKDIYLNRGIILFQLKRYQESIRDYKTYLTFDPNDHQIYYDMGIVYANAGEYQQALQSYNQAISLFPNDKRYYGSRAFVHGQLGNTAAANADRQKVQSMK